MYTAEWIIYVVVICQNCSKHVSLVLGESKMFGFIKVLIMEATPQFPMYFSAGAGRGAGRGRGRGVGASQPKTPKAASASKRKK